MAKHPELRTAQPQKALSPTPSCFSHQPAPKETAPGVYILVLTLYGAPLIGRLGQGHFAGTYLYVGSARGPGGFKRLLRHREVAEGERRTKRWHIDYLLPMTTDLQALWLGTEAPLECTLARLLSGVATPAMPGFGSSDCRCPSHLFNLKGVVEGITDALAEAGLRAEVIPLID